MPAQPPATNPFAIATLVVALVTFIVAFLPLISTSGLPAAVAGVVIVLLLGIVARKQTRVSRAGGAGFTYAGLAVGAFALLIALGSAAVAPALDRLINERLDEAAESVGKPDVTPDPTADSRPPLDTVRQPQGTTTSGGIPVGPEGVAGTTAGANADAVVVRVYFDYLCPYCALFEEINGPTLRTLRESGEIIVDYHPISILDEASLDSVYSTRAASAAAWLVAEAPETFVAFHEALLANQPAEGTSGLSDAQLADLARAVGAPDAAADAIGDYSAYETFAAWVGAATGQAAADLAQLATPTILLDGQQLDHTRYDWTQPGQLERAIADARA